MSFLPLIIFVLGLIIGSFLNVVILRMNTGRSIVRGRSACARCNKALRWYELVPVVSFLALRGKCRSCKLPISFQYPVVELVTAVLFILLYLKIPIQMGFTAYAWLSFFFSVAVACTLIVIAVYDARHKIIPDTAVYFFILLSILSIAVKATLFPGFPLFDQVFSGVLVALPFFILWWLSGGRVMGFGDVKLALGIGWLLGLSGGFAAVMLAFWIGAVFGLLLIAATHRTSLKSEVPFAPFLIIGVFIVGIWQVTIASFFPLWS
jgi:prepilin signal peptidase PulO-like enzyme (type II secretory pathway)